MKIYGKYVDYLKVSGGRVLVTEVRPVPVSVDCPLQNTRHGATVKTDKWMQLHHWQELQALLDSVVNEYEAATRALQPTQNFVGDTITRKAGQHIRIAYKWRENKGCRCFYLSSADTESSDSSSDEEDYQDKLLQKRLGTTEPRGVALSSWQPCGVVLVVSVAPHVPETSAPSDDAAVASSLPPLSPAQPEQPATSDPIDVETDQHFAHKNTRTKKRTIRGLPNSTEPSAAPLPAPADGGEADVLVCGGAAACDGAAPADRATQPLADQQPSNLSMDQVCEQLREVRKAKRKQRAEKSKAARADRPPSKRQEKYAVFDSYSSDEIKLVLSSTCQPVCPAPARRKDSNKHHEAACRNTSPPQHLSSSTSPLTHRPKSGLPTNSHSGVNLEEDVISINSTPASSFVQSPLDTRPADLVQAATACSGAVSLSQRLTEPLDSSLPPIDGSEQSSSGHTRLGVALRSPERQCARRDHRAMTRGGTSSLHLSPRDLKYITYNNADTLDSPDSLPGTLPSIGSTPVPAALPNRVRSLNMQLQQHSAALDYPVRHTEDQVSRPTSSDSSARKTSPLPVLDGIPMVISDVTGYRDDLQSPGSPTQYNPFFVDPIPGSSSLPGPSDDDTSDSDNLDPVTVLSMAPVSSTSLGLLNAPRMFLSTSSRASPAGTHPYNSPQMFEDSSDTPAVNYYGQEYLSSEHLLNANIDPTALADIESVSSDDDERQSELECVSADSVCKLVVNGTDADTLSDCDSDVVRVDAGEASSEGSGDDGSARAGGCRTRGVLHSVGGGASRLTASTGGRRVCDMTRHALQEQQHAYNDEHFFEQEFQPKTSVVNVTGTTATTNYNVLNNHARGLSQEVLKHSLEYSGVELNFATDWNIRSSSKGENVSALENVGEGTVKQENTYSEMNEDTFHSTEMKKEPDFDSASACRLGSQLDGYCNTVETFQVCTPKFNDSFSPILGLSKKVNAFENNSEQFLVDNKCLDMPSTNHPKSSDILPSNYTEINTATFAKRPDTDDIEHATAPADHSQRSHQFSAQQIADTRPFYLGSSLEGSDSPGTTPDSPSHPPGPHSPSHPPAPAGCTDGSLDACIADAVKLRSRGFNNDTSNLREIASDSPQKLSIIKKIFSTRKTAPASAAPTARKPTKAGRVTVQTDDARSADPALDAALEDAADAFANHTEMNKQKKPGKSKVELVTKKVGRPKKTLLNNPSDDTTLDKHVTKRPQLTKTSQYSIGKNNNSNVVRLGVEDVEPNLSLSPSKNSHTHRIVTKTFTKFKSKTVFKSEENSFDQPTESSLHSSASLIKTRTPNKGKLIACTSRVSEASVECANELLNVPVALQSSPTDQKCSPKGSELWCRSLSGNTSAPKPGVVEPLVDPTEFGRQMGMLDNLYTKKDTAAKKRKAPRHDGPSAPSPKQRKMTDHFPKDSPSGRVVHGTESADAVATVALARRANLDEDVEESDEEDLPDIHCSVDPNDSFRSSNSHGTSDVEAEPCSKQGSSESTATSTLGHSQVSPLKKAAARTVNPHQEIIRVAHLTAKTIPESQETGVPLSNGKLVHTKVSSDTNSSIALSKPTRRCRRKPMRFLSPDRCPVTERLLLETLPRSTGNQPSSVHDSLASSIFPSGSSNQSQSEFPSDVATVTREEDDATTAPPIAPPSLVIQGSLDKKKPRNTAKGRVRKKSANSIANNNNDDLPKNTLMDQWLSKPQKMLYSMASDTEGVKGKKGKGKPRVSKKKGSIPAAAAAECKDATVDTKGGNNDVLQDDDQIPSQLPDINKRCELEAIVSAALSQAKPQKRKYKKRKPKNAENMVSTEASPGPSSIGRSDSTKSSCSTELAGSASLSSGRSPSKESSSSKASSKRLSRASTTDGGEDEEDLFNYSIDSWGNTVSPKKGGRLADDGTVLVEDNTMDLSQEEGDAVDPLLALLAAAPPAAPTPRHLEPPRMRQVVHAMRREYDSAALLNWLPDQLPWLTSVLRGTEENEWHQTYMKGPVAMEELHTFRYYGVLEKSQIRTITDFLAVHLEKELKLALHLDPRPTHMYTWRVQVPLVATLMCRAVSGLSWDHSTDLLLSVKRSGALDDD